MRLLHWHHAEPSGPGPTGSIIVKSCGSAQPDPWAYVVEKKKVDKEKRRESAMSTAPKPPRLSESCVGAREALVLVAAVRERWQVAAAGEQGCRGKSRGGMQGVRESCCLWHSLPVLDSRRRRRRRADSDRESGGARLGFAWPGTQIWDTS